MKNTTTTTPTNEARVREAFANAPKGYEADDIFHLAFADEDVTMVSEDEVDAAFDLIYKMSATARRNAGF